MAEQNFANHAKFVPGYHYVIFGILGINQIWSIYRLIYGLQGVGIWDRLLSVALAFALLLIAWYARIFPLKAQDRAIRLEETLRLERLLPAELRPRIGELRPGQLIALRFASDAELPELTREVLAGGLSAPREIKKRVRGWRADHFRM